MASVTSRIVILILGVASMGCGSSPPTLTTDPATVEKLEELAKQGTPGEKSK